MRRWDPGRTAPHTKRQTRFTDARLLRFSGFGILARPNLPTDKNRNRGKGVKGKRRFERWQVARSLLRQQQGGDGECTREAQLLRRD